jgi:Protein of unknown function (DUF2809)
MFRFHKGYFLLAVTLFLVEVGIALFVHDNFIRPYFGDTLVVVLIYCFLKSFLKTAVIPTAIAVLLFSYAIEVLQYYDLIGFLGLENNRLAKCVLGNSFEWVDFIAYTVGIVLVIAIESFISINYRNRPNPTRS